MNYISLVGSRCYGLEIEGSDHDYVVVGEIHTPISIKHCTRFLASWIKQRPIFFKTQRLWASMVRNVV